MREPGIRELADGLVALMATAGYSDSAVESTSHALKNICKLHEEAGKETYDQGIVDAYVADAVAREKSGKISKGQRRFYARTARYLGEAREGKVDFGSHAARDHGLCPRFESAASSLSCNHEWSDGVTEAVRRAAIPYMRWLQGRGIESFEAVDARIVRDYFVEVSGHMEPSSIEAIRGRLKKFHEHLAAESLADDLDGAFGFSIRARHRILKPASHGELACVLGLIDRGEPKGKRDYAIILLGAVLGLRGVDIVGLSRGDVDWANGEINVRQAKTGRMVALPLTADVGEALQDYLLEGRPDRSDDSIFLSCRAPFAPLSPSVPYQILNAYRAKAGLPRERFHGLRRAVGTGLVVGGTPVSTVAQILGHADIEPTRQYISLDSGRLKEVALGLDGLPPMNWGDRP